MLTFVFSYWCGIPHKHLYILSILARYFTCVQSTMPSLSNSMLFFFEWWWYNYIARYGQLRLVYNLMHLPSQTLIISLILAIRDETLLFKSIAAVQWISIEIPKAICSKTLLLCLKALFIWLEWAMSPWFGFRWCSFSFSGINCKSYVVSYDEKWMWSILGLLTPMGTMLPLHMQTTTECFF